jgi:hypothetical protein
VCVLVAGVALAAPATAQNFPFPIPGNGRSSIGIGDIINIVGQGRNGGAISNGRNNNAAAIIGLAGVLYDMSRQRQQPAMSYPGNYPGNYQGNFPGNFPGSYPGNYPGNYPSGYQGNYPPNFPGNAYPRSGYPGDYPGSASNYPGDYPGGAGNYPGASSQGRPQGYAFIENGGLPTRLDPSILPLTVNAGGGQGDAVVGRAIESWNNAGIGHVFELTNGAADLNIDWSGSKCSPGARAETRMARSANYVIPTDLSVRTGGRSPEQLTRVLTHELGHVLGLDHSQDPNDVMYASEQNRSSQLTRRDLAMAHWIYSQSRFAPVIGQLDARSNPSVASNWSSHGLEDEGQPVCTIERP